MQTTTHKNTKKKTTTKKPAAAKAKAKKPDAPKKARDVKIKATFLARSPRTAHRHRTRQALEPQIESLEKIIREKAEPRKVMCEEVHDYRRGQVFVRRKDNGETVDGTERPMKHEERQQTLAGIVNEDIKNHAQAAAGKANGAAKPNGKHEAKPAADKPAKPAHWHSASNLDRKNTDKLPVVGDVWASRNVGKLGMVFRVEKVNGGEVNGKGANHRAEMRSGSAPTRTDEKRHADGTVAGLGCTDFDLANVEWSNILQVTEDVEKLWRDYALLEPVEPEKAKG